MADNSVQKNSPAYRLAALDPEFLLGDSMRGVRLQIEYAKAEERLRAWTVRSTVVVFGSARVASRQSRRWHIGMKKRAALARLVSERGGALISRPRHSRQRHRDRRRTRHHGSGQPRRGGRRGAVDRI